MGILFHIGASHAEAGLFADSSSDFAELRNWGLSFVERWSSSYPLAARYSTLLRHFERRLADRHNSGLTNHCGIANTGMSSEDPFDTLTAFPDIDSTFLWLSDADGMDLEASKWDPGSWNIEGPALNESL